MANILILGGGFGGLIAAEKLASELGSEHQITLVSKSQNFVFYPALVQVAFGKFEPEDISFDLREKSKELGVRFVQGEVLRINEGRRLVHIVGDDFTGDIAYDYLVLVLGRRLATEKAPGFFEHAHHLLDIPAALKFGEAIKDFRAGKIVVGMCPGARLPVPVCETAFALARRFETEISEKRVSITVVFPATVWEAFGGAKIYEELEWTFAEYGIDLITNFPVREITEDKISGDNEQFLHHDLLMLLPPFQGQVMVVNLGIADESVLPELTALCGLPIFRKFMPSAIASRSRDRSSRIWLFGRERSRRKTSRRKLKASSPTKFIITKSLRLSTRATRILYSCTTESGTRNCIACKRGCCGAGRKAFMTDRFKLPNISETEI